MSLRETLPEEYLNGGGQGWGETPSCLRISLLFFLTPKGFNRAVLFFIACPVITGVADTGHMRKRQSSKQVNPIKVIFLIG